MEATQNICEPRLHEYFWSWKKNGNDASKTRIDTFYNNASLLLASPNPKPTMHEKFLIPKKKQEIN